jgi:hypothetical protein
VTVSNPRCGWSGNPAGEETAGVCSAEQQISWIYGNGAWDGQEPKQAKGCMLTGELVQDEERVEVPAARTCERTQDEILISRQGKRWMATEAHLAMLLRRTTAPRPSYCGRARNLRTTCRGCFSSIFSADLCLLLRASTTPLPVHLLLYTYSGASSTPFTKAATSRFLGSALTCVSR